MTTNKTPKNGIRKPIYWFDNDRLRRAFFPWMCYPKTLMRSDSSMSSDRAIRRGYHGHPLLFAGKSKKALSNFWRAKLAPKDMPLPRYGKRASFMARLEVKIRREIRSSLYYRDTDAAIPRMWRFLAHPFESWRNRLWRMAYLYEGLGEIDSALDVYEIMVDEYRLHGDLNNAEMFLREMVKAAPDRPCYRRRLMEIYLEMGWRRHAARELGILEQYYTQQGDLDAATTVSSMIAEQAREPLQKRSLTGEPKIWEPGDAFSFFEEEDDDD